MARAAIERMGGVGIGIDGADRHSAFMLYDFDGHLGRVAEAPLGGDNLDFLTRGGFGAHVAVDVVDLDHLAGGNPPVPARFLLNHQVGPVDRTGDGSQ